MDDRLARCHHPENVARAHREAKAFCDYSLEITLTMGERMLLSQCIREALDDLCYVGEFEPAVERTVRFLQKYYGLPAKDIDLVQDACAGYGLSPRLKEVFSRARQ